MFISLLSYSYFLNRRKLNPIFSGTQSPDAVNKLLRLSDSSHQVKNRAPQRPNTSTSSSPHSSSIPNSASLLTNNKTVPASTTTTTTGLSSLVEQNQHHRHQDLTKLRDTNKLTSESSSLNFKTPTSVSYGHLTGPSARKFLNKNN